MDHGLLVVFLLTSFWLYGAVILATTDWRWNLGRIAQFVLCAAVGGWLLESGRTGPEAIRSTALLFVATVLLPAMIRRCVTSVLLRGRVRAARFWQTVFVVLTWRSRASLAGGLPRLHPLPSAAGAAEALLYTRLLARAYASRSRRAFHETRIDGYVAFGRYGEAADVFERHFSAGGLKAHPPLLYMAVIAYCELGDERKAAAVLRCAEDRRAPTDELSLRRFAAVLRLYALCGRVADLDRFIRSHPQPAVLVPPAGLGLRRGLALVRAGERDAGLETLAEALAAVRPGEERLEETIRQALATAQTTAPAGELHPEVARNLEVVRILQDRPSDAPAFGEAGERPVVTWGLVTAIVAVWVLTEWTGSSTDGRTLLRFGANVPELVRSGEWWRLVSSIFLHVGWLHLFFNAYACYLFGNFVERTAGRWELFTVFLFSGLAGSAASALLGVHVVSAGASGAVFGLVGMGMFIALRFRGTFPPRMRRIYVINFLFIAALNMVYGFIEPHIDNLAHGGGLAAGAVAGLLVAPRGSVGARKRLFMLGGLVGAVLLAAAAFCTAGNVRTGGYPLRVPPLKTYVGAERQWKIEVPVFWDAVSSGLRRMEFADPLGARLRLVQMHAPPLSVVVEPGESVVAQGIRFAGGQEYQETAVIAAVGEERLARFLFQRTAGGDTYVLFFECDEADADAYQPLLDTILSRFEVRPADPPG